MRQGITVTTGLMLAAMMVACSPSKPPEKSEAAQPAEDASASLPAAEPAAPAPVAPAPAAPASDVPPGSMVVVYACDDGSGLTVTYDKSGALVKLPSGSTMLPRAESASGGGGDAYLGEDLSLYRNGNLVQLQVAGKPHTCTQSPTSG